MQRWMRFGGCGDDLVGTRLRTSVCSPHCLHAAQPPIGSIVAAEVCGRWWVSPCFGGSRHDLFDSVGLRGAIGFLLVGLSYQLLKSTRMASTVQNKGDPSSEISEVASHGR
ncbi:hypothetical protein ISN44_As08g029550 [Arabidopsis suecica]|uniref:Uncharacterized protein n=1 Tax=Arabidopsis suecica TaxID=45249 RepID=A0A8T2B9L6_ARASU|nr:hypothetical protein ISN44_As08g029550 [Arabidopsis suecica]